MDLQKWTNISNIAYTIITFFIFLVALFQNRIRDWWNRPDLHLNFKFEPPDCQKTLIQLSPEELELLEAVERRIEITRNREEERQSILNEGRIAPIVSEVVNKRHALVESERSKRKELMEVEKDSTVEAFYFRFRVINTGRGKAEQVEVYASELKELVDGEAEECEFRPVERFLPQNLLWTHLSRPFYPTLSPGMEKNCDLGYIKNPRRRPEQYNQRLGAMAGEAVFYFAIGIQPYTLNYAVTPGTYRLTIKVAAANARPKDFTFEIELTGKWFATATEMFGTGKEMNVKLVLNS
jgi:hypothetical protein